MPSAQSLTSPGDGIPAPVLQVKGLLVASLEAGEWRPGEAIPSEGELAARFGVSQGTARKAIDALAADNLVVRRQGKGTFVATHTEEKASMFRFLRIRRSDGQDEYPASRIIDLKRGKVSAEIATTAGDPCRQRSHRVAPGAGILRRASRARRDRPAGSPVSRLDQGEARRLPGLDLQLLRNPVRCADRCGRRKGLERSPRTRRPRLSSQSGPASRCCPSNA